MPDEPRQTQEQSIKARKNQLFDDHAPAPDLGSSKPFKDFLRDTPAAPLSGGTKAVLWTAGVLVALLLVAALMKGLGGSKPVGKAAGKAVSSSSRSLESRRVTIMC